MASDVDIANGALTLLGQNRIISLDDEVKQAREVKAIYVINRNALLAGYSWSFSLFRAQLPALVETDPLAQYSGIFQLPTDCLRVVQVGRYFPGIDLTDYRGAPTDDYIIEGRKIYTNLGAPLNFRGVDTIEDPAQFSANFAKSLAAYLAFDLAEPLTGSDTKRNTAGSTMAREIGLAIRANAIELPPKKLADDEWLMSRL